MKHTRNRIQSTLLAKRPLIPESWEDQVAHQLLINGQGTMPTKPKRPILQPIQECTPTMAHPFSEEGYKKGIAALKNNNAAGRDYVLVEQPKHLGQKANKWLHTMLNVRFTGNKIPKIWRQSKIIAMRFRRTTDQSPSYAIRANFTNE